MSSEPPEFELFRKCVDLSPKEREKFVAENCAGDIEVEKSLRELLGAHDQNKDSKSLDFEDAPERRSEKLPGGGIVGTFQLIEQLGAGSHGAVFKAHRVARPDEVVAIKLLRLYNQSETGRARFRNEIAVLKLLEHESIARLIASGTLEDGSPYLVMQHVDGQCLTAEVLPDLSTDQRLDLFVQVANAIAFAHEKLILHRDIKPGNVILSADGKAVVSDFGLAKLLDASGSGVSLTNSDHVLGSIGYMAPEQVLSGKHHDVRTDVYGLGALLYFLLTGRPPFSSRDFHTFAREVVDDEPLEPNKLDRSIAPDLAKICLQCIRKNPGTRYGTVQELVADIHRFRDGLPVTARPLSRMQRAYYWVRKNRLASILLLSTVVSTVGLVAALSHSLRVSKAQFDASQEYARKVEGNARRHRHTARELVTQINEIWHDPEELEHRRNLLAVVCNVYSDLLSDDDASLETLYDAAVASFDLGRTEQDLGHLIESGQAFNTAYERFRRVLERDPSHLDVEFDLFHCERRLDLHDKAFSRIKRLVKSDNENKVYLLDAYGNQLQYEAKRLMRAREFDLAEDACNEGEAIFRDLCERVGRDSRHLRHIATHRYHNAQVAVHKSNLSKAKKDIEVAIEVQKEYLTHYQDAATLYNELAHYQKFAAELALLESNYENALNLTRNVEQTGSEALERYPHNDESWRIAIMGVGNRLMVELLQGELEQAKKTNQKYIDFFLKQLKLKPTRKNKIRLALAYSAPFVSDESGFKEATSRLSMSEPLETMDNQELVLHGVLLFRLGRFKQAEVVFAEYEKQEPNRNHTYLELCRAITAGTHTKVIETIRHRKAVWPELYPSSILSELYRQKSVELEVADAFARRKQFDPNSHSAE